MQYISPVSLLETLNIQQLDKKGISLAKKKMLAELDLNGGEAVVINGKELTKNDIIGFFDNLQQTDNLAYHLTIARDPVLLNFLELGILEKGTWFKKDPVYNDPAFKIWISPYFFTSFGSFAEGCINNHNDDEWKTLLRNPQLMDAYYTAKAWDIIEMAIRRDLEDLNHIIKISEFPNWYAEERGNIAMLTGAAYVSMLKCLPKERFAFLTDNYAHAIMRCSVIIFNKINTEKGAGMIRNALLLAAPGNMKKTIEYKQGEMLHVMWREKKDKEDSKISKWGFGAAAVFIIFMFIRGVTGQGGDDIDNNNMPAYFTDTAAAKEQVDSLQKTKGDLKADSVTGTKSKR